jgi:hypothetical protein
MSSLELFLCAIAILGMFPSFTALSQSLYDHLPTLGKYLGPINPLKLVAPLFFFWVVARRRAFEPRMIRLLLVALAFGTLGTVTGGLGCGGFPPSQLREWFVIVLGVAAALSILTFSRGRFSRVLWGWAGVIYGSVILNYLWPTGLNWINAHFFDPTRQVPLRGESPQFLMGFYDIVSLGKLLVWVPWIVGFALASTWADRHSTKVQLVLLPLIAVSTGLSLATTQRGPIVGMVGGLGFYFLHRWRVTRDRQILIGLAALLVMMGAGVALLVPKGMIEQRVMPLFSTEVNFKEKGVEAGGSPTVAHASVLQRWRLFELGISEVSKHPFGHVCTAAEEFQKRGIIEAYHSHNLFLEQFKSRGWLWGGVHLVLWLLALLQSWKIRNWTGSVLVGGLGTICVMGLADHPWFVLNHAMILGLFLFGWASPFLRNEAVKS